MEKVHSRQSDFSLFRACRGRKKAARMQTAKIEEKSFYRRIRKIHFYFPVTFSHLDSIFFYYIRNGKSPFMLWGWFMLIPRNENSSTGRLLCYSILSIHRMIQLEIDPSTTWKYVENWQRQADSAYKAGVFPSPAPNTHREQLLSSVTVTITIINDIPNFVWVSASRWIQWWLCVIWRGFKLWRVREKRRSKIKFNVGYVPA